MHICAGRSWRNITRMVMSRPVMRTALTAGAGLAGSVLAGLLLAGPAQADSGDVADPAPSGLVGDVVAAATTPAADVVAEATSQAGPVTEVTAPVTEASEQVTEASEPVVEVAEQVAEVTEVMERATEVTETVDGLVQHTGDVATTLVDPVLDLPVARILPPVVDPYLQATEPVGDALLAPDGPLAPVLPIPPPLPDPVASLFGASGQAPLAGVSVTTATVDLSRLGDGGRDQDRTLEPVAGPGLSRGALPPSTSGRPPPAGSDPSPVDPLGRPFGQLPMTGSQHHVGNPTDIGPPLYAAAAALTQPATDSVCMRLADELAAVGLVMALAAPPG